MITKEETLDMLKHKACNNCGVYNSTVEFIVNPFDEEVYNTINKEWLCSKCYQILCDDI